MFYNIRLPYTMVIYCHSMVITTVIWLYNTEWQYYHEMAVNYRGKKFYNIGPRLLDYIKNYCRKKYYSTGPKCQTFECVSTICLSAKCFSGKRCGTWSLNQTWWQAYVFGQWNSRIFKFSISREHHWKDIQIS